MGIRPAVVRGWLSSRHGLALALVAAIIGTTTIGVAAAAGTGLISACVNRAGQLRIITPGASTTWGDADDAQPINECGRNETLLTWNQSGPQGPTGPTGATGPAGPTGPSGLPAVSVVGGGTPGNVTLGSTWYMALYAPRFSNTESVVAQAVPVAGTLSQLHADAEIDPGCFHPGGVNCAAQYWTLTVIKNGSPTALVCQIIGSSFLNGTPRLPCSNTTNTAHFAAGDLVSIKVEASLFGPAASPIHWTAAFTAD